jgi:oxaloacetate decarboxylase beta subunit
MKKINTMKKLSLIIFIIVTLFGNSTYAHSDDLSPNLTKGKWLNKSDGYKLSANSDKTVERYKTITFGVDQTFVLDSVKLKYSGEWRFIGNDIYLEFNDSNIKTKIANIENDKLIIGKDSYNSYSGAFAGLINFYEFTGVPNATPGHIIMVLVGIFFIFLAIRYNYEPLLLIPIGIGIIIGNIPFYQAEGFNLQLGIYEEGSVMSYLYFGVRQGIYPPLIFLGIGAMTDFSSLISNPKLMILGAAAQVGIFLTFLGALVLGFGPAEAGAIGIIGGADGPTAIFLSSKLAPHLIGPIAIAAYSYMALVPIIQPPFMRLLITKKERLIRMKPPRSVSKLEKIMFPIVGLLLTAYISPSALPLLGMLFFGNLLKESTVTKRLADTARTSLIDIVTILLGITVGASTQADVFLTSQSMWIFGLGALSFIIATCGGLLFAKLMNVFLKGDNKINPLIGAAGVSAVPDSARVVQHEGLKADPTNHLLMHAMAPNVSGVIGSAVAAGILLSFLM